MTLALVIVVGTTYLVLFGVLVMVAVTLGQRSVHTLWLFLSLLLFAAAVSSLALTTHVAKVAVQSKKDASTALGCRVEVCRATDPRLVEPGATARKAAYPERPLHRRRPSRRSPRSGAGEQRY